ncbi:MAG: tetratricopeptide repeat protein [Gemmataceae bacterium]
MLDTESALAITTEKLDLSGVHELYTQGLCLQAYRAGEKIKPLRAWRGADRILAGRIAYNLGAPKFAVVAHRRAYREAPHEHETRYYHARALLERCGPLRAWRFLRETGELPEAEPWVRADWLAFHGYVVGRLRDFDAAELWLGRAELLAPERPWICVERSYLLEMEDRVPEALEASARALELRPWYRPGVQSKAHILQQLDRDQDALELLTEAADRIESLPVLAQLAAIQTELRHYQDARQTYERFAELAVLLEKKFGEWLAARRSDTAYYCGDCAAAAEWAKQVKEPFFEKVAELLSRTPLEGARVLLEVGFVRQHHQTCVPATLAALSRYWQMTADHLEVAAEICYDGTPDHRERYWAEEHGWVAREFTVTWDSARALLDRGIPFTLTTVEPVSGHMQAVIGYDSRRGTLLIRDPSMRNFTEFIAETMFEHCRSTGPRGMALVPLAEASRFDGVELLDAELYDRVYRLQRALHVHDRAQAEQHYGDLQAAAPGHRLTLQAQRLLAGYDGDLTELLASVEKLLELYPDDAILQLAKLHHLRELARREERVALLRDICSKPKSDPVFFRQYAQELSVDARVHEHTTWLVKRAMRYRPWDAANYATLANVRWDQRRFEEGVELYRMAACLDDKDEGLARSYFLSSRHLRQTDEALRFLEKRNERFGAQSSLPPRTLFWAYSVLERSSAAAAMLEQALARRPDDGELILFASDVASGQGDFARSDALLQQAKGRCPQASWLRTAANLESSRGEPARALALWQQVLEAEPLAVDANRAVARLLAETDSRQAALDHLRRACERFPHNFNLHQGLIEWLREDGPQALEPVVRRIIGIHPADAWARRELALTLVDQRRIDEAFAELEEAERLEPRTTTYFAVRGQVCEHAGKIEEASAAYRQAIEISVDNDFAIARLMHTCATHAERCQALAFVEQELARQVIFGDGLLAYQAHAQGTLEPDELLAALQRTHAARPDLWHAWSALINQLGDMQRFDEAHELAQQATERFPLLPRLWLDLAAVCGARKDREGEKAAVQRALQLNPSWGTAVRHLAELHDRAGELAEARQLLERGIQSTPLDQLHHGCLADILWRQEEKEAALGAVQKALQLDPGYNWAWSALREWSAQLERPELPGQLARELTQRRGGEARSWLLLAENLHGEEALQERLSALDRALQLNPRCVEAFDRRAELLAGAGRFDEALAACQPAVFGNEPPLQLQSRSACIEASRGNLHAAIERMTTVIRLDPNHYRYRELLADWYRQAGNAEAYRSTSQEMVRIAPQYAIAHGYLGDALLQIGDTPAGKEALRRALELDPGYVFPTLLLFDLSMFEQDFTTAEEMLLLLNEHLGGESTQRRAVQLAAARGDRRRALLAYRELCAQPLRDIEQLERATSALIDAGWSDDTQRALEGIMADVPGCPPRVAGLWIERRLAAGDWSCVDQLPQLLERGALGDEALLAYLRALSYSAGKLREMNPFTDKARNEFHQLVQRYRERLRANSNTWGEVGSAFGVAGDYAAAVDWMSDWERPERSDVPGYALLNLGLYLRELDRNALARQVNEAALRLAKPDSTTPFNLVWLAVEDVLAGKTEAARAALDSVGEDADEYHQYFAMLVEALAEVQEAPPAARRELFARARQRFAAARATFPALPHREGLLPTYRRFVNRLAEDCGGMWPGLWAWWRCQFPGIPGYEE